jgi:hypothetical protein
VNANDWKLTIDGEVEKPYTLTLDELKKFPRATVTLRSNAQVMGAPFTIHRSLAFNGSVARSVLRASRVCVWPTY